MTNEIIYRHTAAAATLYAQILNGTGQIYNGATFEAITDANWGNYDIPLAEAGTASQIYLANFPAVAAGVYTVHVYEQAGGSPAISDELLGAGKMDWDGSAESVLATVDSVVDAILVDTGTDIPASIAALNDLDAAAIWAYATRTLTQAAASVTAVVTGSDISVYRGTTWSISLTGLGNISAYDTIYFSVKASLNDSDDDAILRVKNDASGLERFNQAAPIAATNGTITIDDATNGDITITVQEEETISAPIIRSYSYDVKGVDNDGSVDLLSSGGKFNVYGDVTRAIT